MKTKKLKLLVFLALASVVFITGCKKDNYEAKVNECPVVVSTIPIDKAINVPLNQVVSATFNVKMNPATITGASFSLQQGATITAGLKSASLLTPVAGTISYSGETASFTPSSLLIPNTVYTGRVTTAAKDLIGQALQADYVWTFTTIAQVTLASNPTIGGTTSGAGTFNQGVSVTVVATPNAGYVFTNWTENGVVVSTNSSYLFTMAANRTLVANFSLQFTVTLSSNPLAGGTTLGAGLFTTGTSVTALALPNTGYTFVNWTDNGVIASTNASFVFVLTANRTLVANFAINAYALNITAPNGTYTKTPDQATYNHGTVVPLTATANTGYTFVNWTEGATVLSIVPNFSVTMTSPRTLVANFAINAYALNITAPNGTYTKTPDQATYNHGTVVPLTATANTGYTFVNWTEGATVISTVPNFSVTMTGPKTLVANFAKNALAPIVVSTNPADGDKCVVPDKTVTAIFSETMDPSNPATSFTLKQTLTSTPVAGAVTYSGTTASFKPSVNLLPNTLYTATITTGAKSLAGIPLAADFVWKFNTGCNPIVTLSSIPALGGTTDGAGSFSAGTSVTVTASNNPLYNFVNWTEGGVIVSTSPSYQFTMPGNNRYLVANFTAIAATYTLTVTAVNGTVVKNPVLVNYPSGSTVTLTATPNTGFVFSSWSGDATGTTSPLTVTMNANKNITANFTAIAGTFTLNVIAVNGTVLKNPDLVSYNSGASVQLTATANSGYTFTSWSGDATGTVSPLTVIMNANKNITANFTADVIQSGPLAIDLGCAAPFAILAGSTITNTGPSIVTGNVGLSPGSALVGFPPGTIIGTQEITTPTAAAAKLCLTTAFNDGQSRSLNAISLPGQLGGLTLAPGLYSNSSTSGISGTGANGILTLDAQGNSNAVWIFQMGSTLTTDPATSIVLAGGAKAANIFWIVGSSATLGTTSVFYGNILASQAITLNTGAVLNGRALTQIAAVTLDASTITKP